MVYSGFDWRTVRMKLFLSILIGYVYGNFLTAWFAVRLIKSEDIFEVGSKNPGMANVAAAI